MMESVQTEKWIHMRDMFTASKVSLHKVNHVASFFYVTVAGYTCDCM